MKKEYLHCMISLAMLFLGVTGCITAILLGSLLDSTKSILVLFGLCFILLGITSYVEHNKKYQKMKYLKNKQVKVIAHWTFKSNTSSYINELLYSKKFSSSSTIMLTLLLFLVIACCVYLSGEKYSLQIGLILTALSLIGSAASLFINAWYYQSKLTSDTEVIIGEDCIYFIDDLYTLNKSIYFLEDVRIDYSDENLLQFLYGDYDLFTGPMYTVNIPIPAEELDTARRVQGHYLELIRYE